MDVLERGALLLARDVRVPQVVVVVRGLDVSGYRLQPETLRRRLEALPPRPDHEKQWSEYRGKGRSERRGGCQKTDNARTDRPLPARNEPVSLP